MIQSLGMIYLAFAMLYSIILIVGLIVGIVEKINERKPVYHDPDRRVYFAKNHSAGFRFIVRFLLFGALVVYLPQFAAAFTAIYTADHLYSDRVAVPAIVLTFAVSFILGVIIFALTFNIKLIHKVDRVEVAPYGLRVTYRRKDLRESVYPIDHFQGYEGKKHDLLFADRVGNNARINTSYLGKKYSAALGNDLIALRTGKHLNKVPVTIPAMVTHISEMDIKKLEKELPIHNKVPEKKADTVKEAPKKTEPVKPAFPENDSGILSAYGSLNTDTSSSILSAFGSSIVSNSTGPIEVEPFKPEPTLGLIDGTEAHIEEASKGTLSKDEPLAPSVDTSALSSSSRIFIKNTYLTDIEKKISSFGKTDLNTSASHYPGSSWMYVEVKADVSDDSLEIFNSTLKLMRCLAELSRDVFLYSESDDMVAFIKNGSDIRCRKAGKSCIFNSDTLNLEPCEDTELPDADTKTFIKRKFYIDV